MYRSITITLLFLAVGNASADEAAELKKLNGVWKPTAATIAGQDLTEKLKGAELTIKDGEYSAVAGDNSDEGKMTLHPTLSPKGMDIESKEGPNAGTVILAIYKLEGNQLTVCYALGNNSRPTEFKTIADKPILLITYKRTN